MVSEPPEDDQDGDCEDVGVTFVNIRDILLSRRDITDQDLDSKFGDEIWKLLSNDFKKIILLKYLLIFYIKLSLSNGRTH